MLSRLHSEVNFKMKPTLKFRMAKQDEFIRTALRVPPTLHAKIHAAAAEAGRTFNAEIVARLEQSFSSLHAPDVRLLLDKAELDSAEAAVEAYRLRSRIAELALTVQIMGGWLHQAGVATESDDVVRELRDAREALGDALDAMADPGPQIQRLAKAHEKMREHAARLNAVVGQPDSNESPSAAPRVRPAGRSRKAR